MNTAIKTNIDLKGFDVPQNILQSVLAARSNGRISEAVDQFDDRFAFNDHALGLEFTDKRRLTEFFQEPRELFPDIVVEVTSTFVCGGHVIAERKLTATETMSYWTQVQEPISLPGISIVRIENGRITHWSDYYDEKTSRRMSVASLFTDCIDY